MTCEHDRKGSEVLSLYLLMICEWDNLYCMYGLLYKHYLPLSGWFLDNQSSDYLNRYNLSLIFEWDIFLSPVIRYDYYFINKQLHDYQMLLSFYFDMKKDNRSMNF